MCQTKNGPRHTRGPRFSQQSTGYLNFSAPINKWAWPAETQNNNGLFAPGLYKNKAPTEDLGANQNDDSNLLFIEDSIDSQLDVKPLTIDNQADYYTHPRDEYDEILMSPKKKSNSGSVQSWASDEKPFGASTFHGACNQILGKRAHTKEVQDSEDELAFQLLRDAEAEEFIEILYDSLDDTSSSGLGSSSSVGSLSSFGEPSILSECGNSSLNNAQQSSQSTATYDKEQNVETSATSAHHIQESTLTKSNHPEKVSKATAVVNTKPNRSTRLGLADASHRFVTFCKARKWFSSITEVATEISIDRKRLYDIANIFQELDVISKEDNAFFFRCNGKILPLNQLQQRIAAFERKGSVTSLPCTALLIIRHYVVDGNNGYTADELVDAVYHFYSSHPKYDVQKKNTIKRRVYDSLNILQGVGMIMKTAVNHGFYRFYLDLQRT